MFDDSHYVPILKGKQGELDALQNTSKKLIGGFTPLLEIPPIPPTYIEGQDDVSHKVVSARDWLQNLDLEVATGVRDANAVLLAEAD